MSTSSPHPAYCSPSHLNPNPAGVKSWLDRHSYSSSDLAVVKKVPLYQRLEEIYSKEVGAFLTSKGFPTQVRQACPHPPSRPSW